MPNYPEVGDTETLSLAIDVAGVPTDPATLVLTIEAPDGTETVLSWPADPEILRDSAGRFRRILTYTQPGMWAYRWAATTPNEGQGDRVLVRPGPLDAIPRSLSLEQLKRRLDITGNDKDDVLADDLAAAFYQAQAAPPYGTGRVLAPDPTRATDDPVVRRVLSTRRRIRVPDAREITTVTLDGTALTTFEPLEKNGLIVQLDIADDYGWTQRSAWDCYQEGAPFVRRTVVITGRFGFETIPEPLAGAIYVLAGRWHNERQAQYADQVEILEGGAVQSYYRQLPPRVRLAFAEYQVPAAAGGLR
jgi:hypothetical protein